MIGAMRHRIELQENTPTKSARGSVTDAWARKATVWAAWMPNGSREVFAHQQTNTDVTDVFRIRYRSDINAKWRVVFEGRTLYLAKFPENVDGRDRYLLLTCQERKTS